MIQVQSASFPRGLWYRCKGILLGA